MLEVESAKPAIGWRPWLIAGLSVGFLVALSTVPYHVASRPTISESYVYGYNNHVAELLVAGWLALLAVWGPPLRVGQALGKPLTRATLGKALVITGLVSVALFAATRHLNGISESEYMNDRLRLLLEGRRPFRDFEFAYGAGLLYVPAALVWVGHLRPADAYGVVWIACSLLGVVLLYLILRAVPERPGAQRAIFLLFWMFGLTFLANFGLNYTLLRYALPCWLATVVHRRLVGASTPWQSVKACIWPLPGYALLLLVSPELAIAFAVGMAIYLLVFGRVRTWMHALAYAAMVVGMLGVSWVAQRLGALSTLEAFGAGGYNFPVMPAPHLLLLFFFSGLCALYAGQVLRDCGRPDILLALIAGSGVGLAGALGRCDPVHATMSAFGLVLAGLFLLSGYPRLRRGVLIFAWFVLIALKVRILLVDTPLLVAKAELPVFFAHEFNREGVGAPGTEPMTTADRRILAQMTRTLDPAIAREKFAERRAYARVRGPLDVPQLFGMRASTAFYAPLGFSPDRAGMYHTPAVEEGYFHALLNVTTPAEVERKVGELSHFGGRPLLLPPDFGKDCGPMSEASLPGLRELFHYPYRARVMHPENLLLPFCQAIQGRYAPVGPAVPAHFGYVMWAPRGR